MEAKSPAPKLDLTGVDRKIFFWFFGMEFWLGILLPLQKNLNCNFWKFVNKAYLKIDIRDHRWHWEKAEYFLETGNWEFDQQTEFHVSRKIAETEFCAKN